MVDLATSLLSLWILLVNVVVQPRTARCPPGFVIANVRTSSHVEPVGTFTCDRPPIGGDHDVKRWTGKSTAVQPPGVFKGRIYCGSSTPIVVGTDREVRTVRCLR